MPNGSIDRDVLHDEFISALDDRVEHHSDVDERPLELELKHPLPAEVRVYLYTLTKAGGTRPDDEFNIQVFIPGVGRGESGPLDHSDEKFVILAGYHGDSGVFVLWDAYLHDEFSHSETIQVKWDTIESATRGDIDTQTRHLDSGDETVISADGSSLQRAILRRVRLTGHSLPEGSNPVEEPEEEVDSQKAPDYEVPEEREVTSTRAIRNTGIVNQLKEEYNYQCQVCGEKRMRGTDTYYAEGHHLKPLNDGGPDNVANIVVLCPNHHADFDYGMIKIDPDSLDITHAYEDDRGMTLDVLPGHDLDSDFLEYNNNNVAVF